jgi:cell filamentation protein
MTDPYVYPDSNVLINKLNIKEQPQLTSKEDDISQVRATELRLNPIKGNFDLNHLKSIHNHIFQDVYSWAGEVRTVDIAKGGSLFALPHYIDKEANKLFASLSEDNHLKGMDKDSLVAKGAYYLGEINALHPFSIKGDATL